MSTLNCHLVESLAPVEAPLYLNDCGSTCRRVVRLKGILYRQYTNFWRHLTDGYNQVLSPNGMLLSGAATYGDVTKSWCRRKRCQTHLQVVFKLSQTGSVSVSQNLTLKLVKILKRKTSSDPEHHQGQKISQNGVLINTFFLFFQISNIIVHIVFLRARVD